AGTIVPITDKDHYTGNKNAKLVLIEYSDFECPFCVRVHPTIKQLMDKYGDDLAWDYRHFPLSFHSKALPTAIASECVANQGGNDAFWKFADIVFEKQNYNYPSIIKELGLSQSEFDTCFKRNTFTTTQPYACTSGPECDKINQQTKEGAAAGVTGTPGNILYNPKTKESRLIPGARPIDMFETDIDAMLKNAK
ncbi:MAG TPA: DsbA family protein, partial [Candidatus Peribacteria bacterium]|nr:DsbA family protein [Candidatus Peribacteria bacterium]